MNEQIAQGAPSSGRHPLKLKALLVSEDAGRTWLLVRQFYITDMVTNRYLDDLLQGRRFGLLNGDSNVNDRDNPLV
jgi:hypothetical protein